MRIRPRLLRAARPLHPVARLHSLMALCALLIGSGCQHLAAPFAAPGLAPTTAAQAKVYVIWGQSNARGRSLHSVKQARRQRRQSNARGRSPMRELPTYLSGKIPGAYLWNGSSFTPLEAQTNSNYPQKGDAWGLEMQLAYQLKRAQPDEAVYLVKYALGNTGLTPRVAPTWNPEVRNSLYDKAQQSLQAALNDLSAAGKTPRVAGFVWVQGGYDAKVKAPQADYARLQGQLFEGVRQTAQNPLLPIVDLLVRSEHYPLLVVNDAKAQLAARLPEIKLLSAEALQDIGDDMHYNGAASRAVGRHSFEYLTRQSYAPPSSLPVPLVHLDLNRQDGWALARLLKVKQVVDLSGHGMTFSSASSTPPTLIEGVLGKGFSSVRAEGGQALVAPRNPLTANRPYTVAAVIGNFANAKAAQARYLLGGGESNSLALYYPSGSNLLQLRHGQKTILKSRTPTASSPQIVIIVYDPTNSTMRVNGVSEATYRLAAPFSTAGKLRLFDFAGAQRSIKIDLSTMMMFDRALGLDEVQQLEGYLAHRFMLPLPASHPFAQVAPQ